MCNLTISTVCPNFLGLAFRCAYFSKRSMRFGGRNKEKYATYRCPTNRRFCSNKEISRDYLERYTIYLLETHIFNSKALGRIKKNILKYSSTAETILQQDYSAIDAEIARNAEELKNIADAVAAGLLSSALVERLNRLEDEKQELAARRSRLASLSQNSDTNIDTGLILSEYASLKKTPSNPAYKTFISSFIDRIEVGRYTLVFVLKTGLDTSITVRRQEIYEYGKRINDKN